MGRGRAKAKQTKVARQLKYATPNTDLDSLQRELAGDSGHSHNPVDDWSDQDSWADEEWRRA